MYPLVLFPTSKPVNTVDICRAVLTNMHVSLQRNQKQRGQKGDCFTLWNVEKDQGNSLQTRNVPVMVSWEGSVSTHSPWNGSRGKNRLRMHRGCRGVTATSPRARLQSTKRKGDKFSLKSSTSWKILLKYTPTCMLAHTRACLHSQVRTHTDDSTLTHTSHVAVCSCTLSPAVTHTLVDSHTYWHSCTSLHWEVPPPRDFLTRAGNSSAMHFVFSTLSFANSTNYFACN